MNNIIYILMCEVWNGNRYTSDPVAAYKSFEDAEGDLEMNNDSDLEDDSMEMKSIALFRMRQKKKDKYREGGCR